MIKVDKDINLQTLVDPVGLREENILTRLLSCLPISRREISLFFSLVLLLSFSLVFLLLEWGQGSENYKNVSGTHSVPKAEKE